MNKQPPELDPELRRLFAEEAELKASEISRGIAEFNEADRDLPQRLDRMVWLQMRFAEYSGIANTLGLKRSGRNCALVVDELTQVIAGARDAEDSLVSLFDNALESIDDALEYLHGDDIDPSRVFEGPADEPTVAEQLPSVDFPEIRQAPSPATTASTVQAGREQALPSDVDASLLEVFMDEADELIALGERSWQDWQDGKHSQDAIKELRRVFHTLKGGARLTQMFVLGDYMHAAEDSMAEAEQEHKAPALKAKLRKVLDQLQQGFTELQQGQTAFFGDLTDPAENKQASSKAATSNVDFGAQTTAPTSAPTPASTASAAEPNSSRPNVSRNVVRVRTQTLELLRQRSSEVNALRNKIQQVTTALKTEQALSAETINEASSALRQARFSLERLINKLPAEALEQLSDVQLESQMALQSIEDLHLRLNRHSERSADLHSHIERALQGQSKASFALQENIHNTRLVPFSDFSGRLHRIVRQTLEASDNKQAELVVVGAELEVDRPLLEQLLPALEHMLRNALVHGIETVDQRRDVGKPPVGLLKLKLRRSRGRLELELADDGAGLALEAIKQKAIDMGLLSPDDDVSSRRLQRLIFHPGLSAAASIDQLAGRGVGMDVVEHSVHELGGSIDVSSEAGIGCRFTLRLPMGESTVSAIIVDIAGQRFAVPQNDIRSIQRLDDETLSRGYQTDVPIAWNGQGWRLNSLGHWLGLGEGQLPGPRRSLPALLVNTNHDNHAIVVDHCGDAADYNVEKLPPAVTGIVGVSAAIILEDGQITPLLDLPALCQSGLQYSQQGLPLAETKPDQRYRVMLIDDSSTWLRQLNTGLGRLPFDLISCKDGQEALACIEKHMPELLIVDLEMPRMDGLEFLQRIRRNPTLQHIPAIMFSTVTGSNQRNRARQLGAKAWVKKNANLVPLIREIDKQLGTEFARLETGQSA